YDYLSYLFKQKDMSDPVLKKTVDSEQLLQEIDEWQSLNEKHSKINKKTLENMNEQEKDAYDIDARRMCDLDSSVRNKAPLYLFYQSPCKEENFRVFYDYYTSGSTQDIWELVKSIIREEMKDDQS
ncbi:MAG: hypothetical protein PHW39_04095, partial [Syntrophomonadaceae bacterium]|nr:hypothetical protein [Syntrophomonadaceae bacterium]